MSLFASGLLHCYVFISDWKRQRDTGAEERERRREMGISTFFLFFFPERWSGGIIKRGAHDRQEVSPMRLDKPLTWARTAQTPSINDTMTARTHSNTHSNAHKSSQSHLLFLCNRQLVFFFFPDFLANLTVFQQIGGFNIRLVDLWSQMFFVQKNGLQCLKFVCDPRWIICAWRPVCFVLPIPVSSRSHLLPLSLAARRHICYYSS